MWFPTYQHLAAFVFAPSGFFWEEVSNNRILINIGRNFLLGTMPRPLHPLPSKTSERKLHVLSHIAPLHFSLDVTHKHVFQGRCKKVESRAQTVIFSTKPCSKKCGRVNNCSWDYGLLVEYLKKINNPQSKPK